MRILPTAVFSMILFLAFSPLSAQDVGHTSDRTSSTMSVLGTSTMHDWESVVEDFFAEATVNGDQLQSVKLKAVVESIKSGKGKMDENTYKAMKSDKYPEITFTATELDLEDAKATGQGQLTIGGVTKDIPVDVMYTEASQGGFEIAGEIPVKMTEYGIAPPVAMLGAIKTGEDVTIKFKILMKP